VDSNFQMTNETDPTFQGSWACNLMKSLSLPEIWDILLPL
jgi:hypothetical protein